jgi:hypothetical protein
MRVLMNWLHRNRFARWLVSMLLAIALFVITTYSLQGYSLLGTGNPYPIAFGFPLGFEYMVVPGRTVYFLSIALADFVAWLMVALVIVFVPLKALLKPHLKDKRVSKKRARWRMVLEEPRSMDRLLWVTHTL